MDLGVYTEVDKEESQKKEGSEEWKPERVKDGGVKIQDLSL